MLEFIQSQFLFYFAVILVLILPGYFLLLAFFGRGKMSTLERFTVSVGTSILITTFLMLLLSRFGLLFSKISLTLVLLIFCTICFAIYQQRFGKSSKESTDKNLFDFSFKQIYFIVLVLFLSIFLRTVYLQNTLPSSSTDLGHHMYWSKLFSETGTIQDYTHREIVEENGKFIIDEPKNISDFVIGEHLIFSAVSLISGASFISAFPVLVLFLINIFGLLAIFILSLRLFEGHSQNKTIALFALLFTGVLFSIDPPQAKFVGGGVVGNILGNLLIPLTFYFYIRFIREKVVAFFFFALLFSMGLFYTHHLSALIFLFSFACFIILSLLFNFQETKNLILAQKKILFSPLLISFFIFVAIFISTIYTPTYLTNSAVNTVVGAIKKVEHTGLSMFQFRSVLGEARFSLGAFGLLMLLVFFKKSFSRYSFLLLLSWVLVIALISLAPSLVKISIPSGRVANYGVYPFALLSALALVFVFKKDSQNARPSLFSQKMLFGTFLAILFFIITDGLSGNGTYLILNGSAKKTLQTFQASEYLASKMEKTDQLASDHVYLFADSWVKLFFMRDYYFPSYRANFERYENGIDKKEFCTRDMISNPGGELGQKCYSDLRTNFVIVDKAMDSAQFQKLSDFSQIYSNDKINVYYRKK